MDIEYICKLSMTQNISVNVLYRQNNFVISLKESTSVLIGVQNILMNNNFYYSFSIANQDFLRATKPHRLPSITSFYISFQRITKKSLLFGLCQNIFKLEHYLQLTVSGFSLSSLLYSFSFFFISVFVFDLWFPGLFLRS